MTGLTEKERAALAACPLFGGTTEETAAAFAFFQGEVRRYRRGEFLHRMGEPLPRFAVVLSGTVEVGTVDFDGNQVLMATAAPGETFGESLAYLHIPAAPVEIHTPEGAAVAWLSPAPLRETPLSPEGERMLRRMTGMLAARALSMNDRIQILSKKSLRERLCTYLTQCARAAGSRTFSVPFDRERMAVYLGANRSALSRELSVMQKEGLLTYYRNTFRLPE